MSPKNEKKNNDYHELFIMICF